MHRQRIAILFAAAAGMMATFMPWIRKPLQGTIYGTDVYGWVTFGLFLISFIIACLGNKRIPVRSGMLIGTVIPALVATFIGIWKMADLNAISTSANLKDPDGAVMLADMKIEAGLYLVVVAGAVLTIVALLMNIRSKHNVEQAINTRTISEE